MLLNNKDVNYRSTVVSAGFIWWECPEAQVWWRPSFLDGKKLNQVYFKKC